MSAPVITEEQRRELKYTFDIFDEAKAGCIPASQIGLLLRNAGETPTEARIKQFVTKINEQTGTVDFEAFISMVLELRKTGKRLTSTDLEEAFRVFDSKKTGKIQASELRKVLTENGEKLSEQEMDAVLATIGMPTEGDIDYIELSSKLLP